jgi:hypothetical protein
MSDDSLSDEPALRSWRANHSDILPYISFVFSPSCSHQERQTIHRQTISAVEQSVARVHSSLSTTKTRIQSCQRKPIPRVSPFYFDDISAVFFVRQHTWVLLKIRHLFLRIHQKLHENLRKSVLIHSAILELFSSKIIPKHIICRVNQEYLSSLGTSDNREIRQFLSLQSLALRMETALQKLPRARWSRSFVEFLTILVSHCHPDPILMYFSPIPMEQSLARFFFHPESLHRNKIDQRLQALSNRTDFGDDLVNLSSALIVEHTGCRGESVCGANRSILLLVFFRMLFNRYYELNPSFFAAKSESGSFIRRVRDLSVFPASEFSLPWNLLPVTDHSMGVRTLFISQPGFRTAANALSTALFEPNPFDQLYRIHQSLAAIHVAVVQGPAGLLSFDELFSLFCGVLMATDFPDGFYLHWLINNFIPKDGMAPAFEYAAANLEALVRHIDRQWGAIATVGEADKTQHGQPDQSTTL